MIANVSAGSETAGFNTEHHSFLNGKWNEADQLIGTKAVYIQLRLAADIVTEEDP